MRKYTLENLKENYNLELKRILKEIKKIKKKNPIILLQFPDGLKPYATSMVDFLTKNSNKNKKKVEILIWLESCYGACDTPILPGKIENKIDLMIQFGHNSLMPKKI